MKLGCTGAASLALAVTACGTLEHQLPPPKHAGGGVLWHLVHDQCVPGRRLLDDPSPCASISPGEEAHGFALLKDRVGLAQFLLIPTARVTGIEDPKLLLPTATNYFLAAWEARGIVETRLFRSREPLAVTVNSAYGRSQDQLHLHIDCMDASVSIALHSVIDPEQARWTQRPLLLKGHRYSVRWIAANDLASGNPFKLLASDMPGARQAMGAWTLALVDATARDGSKGFFLLAHRADPAAGDKGSAEELQDHACR